MMEYDSCNIPAPEDNPEFSTHSHSISLCFQFKRFDMHISGSTYYYYYASSLSTFCLSTALLLSIWIVLENAEKCMSRLDFL